MPSTLLNNGANHSIICRAGSKLAIDKFGRRFGLRHLLGLAGRPLLHLIFLPFLPMFCWPYLVTKHTTNASKGGATTSSAQQTIFHSRMNTDASAWLTNTETSFGSAFLLRASTFECTSFFKTSDRLFVLSSSCSRLLSLFCSKSRSLTLMNDQCLLRSRWETDHRQVWQVGYYWDGTKW